MSKVLEFVRDRMDYLAKHPEAVLNSFILWKLGISDEWIRRAKETMKLK